MILAIIKGMTNWSSCPVRNFKLVYMTQISAIQNIKYNCVLL